MGLFDTISNATGLPKKKVLQLGLSSMILFIVFGIGASVLTNLIGVAYPVFMSFHALESEGEDDDKQWLTYWVVFGLFNIADQFAGFILRFIPFYYVLKVVVLIWLFHPATHGATFVYKNYIHGYWIEYGGKLEEAERELEKSVQDSIQAAKQKAGSLVNKKIE